MTTNRKVLLLVSLMLILLTLATIISVSINFKDFGYKNAQEKAELTAESVRDGLTAHMVNGTMDKRFYFLDNMAHHQKIQNLRVLRSDKVIEQFGADMDDEQIRDDIDKKVLREGKSFSQLIDDEKGIRLRVTIPYIATAYSKPNCLECHSAAREGDVLGAISMEVDITDIQNEGLLIVLKTLGISIIFLIIAIFTTNYYISPYVKLFDDLEMGIENAYRGNFSFQIKTTLKNEAGVVARRLNELSDIYRFKKTIELDKNKREVIKRLIHIFENKLGIRKLAIFEVNHQHATQHLFYASIPDFPGKDNKNPHLCRAFRTGRIVVSTDFPDVCEACLGEGPEFICVPHEVSENYSLLIRFMSDDSQSLQEIQQNLPIIRNYLNIAHPVLESKVLMEILEESSYKDGLTELYNRRYLNTIMDDNLLKGYERLAILMIDIDFFKEVNDTYGHDIGDNVIQGLSQIIRDDLGLLDHGIRFGGEEFMVILPEKMGHEAEKRAHAIKEKFAKLRFEASGETFHKTLSIGISLYPDDAETIWKTIKFADVALYKAKEEGRNKIIRFKPEYFPEEEY